jgi:hypothetical protein
LPYPRFRFVGVLPCTVSVLLLSALAAFRFYHVALLSTVRHSFVASGAVTDASGSGASGLVFFIGGVVGVMVIGSAVGHGICYSVSALSVPWLVVAACLECIRPYTGEASVTTSTQKITQHSLTQQALCNQKHPPLHSQQQGQKTSIIPSASDPQHLFTYPYNFPRHSKSIPWTFVTKGDLWAPETGQRTYSSIPHHSTHHGHPRNDGIFVATA